MDEAGRDYLNRLIQSGCEMDRMIEDLLHLSRLPRADMKRQSVDLSLLADAIISNLRSSDPQRHAVCLVEPGINATADSRLMRVALENLLNNAWKFSNRQPEARIEFGIVPQPGERVYFVRDNGVGFNMAFANKLFGPFQRLHSAKEFPGHGIGLATVQRIIHRHGGRIWAKSEPGPRSELLFYIARWKLKLPWLKPVIKIQSRRPAQNVNRPLRVLLVEDSETDAALLLLELRQNGFEPSGSALTLLRA